MKKTMLDYVAETPVALERALDRSEALTAPAVDLLRREDFRILRIVASGSSRNAACAARPLLRRLLGMEVLVTPPHTFACYEHELPPDELTLVVSQSGYSTNALEALEVIRRQGGTAIGVTSDPASDMAQVSDLLVDYGCGQEQVGYVTMGISTLILFFQLLALEGGRALGRVSPAEADQIRSSLAAAAAASRDCIRQTPPFLESHYLDLSSMGTVFLCGAGACCGAAAEGALKLCETLQIPAMACETEEYLHGPELQLTPNHTVFFLDGAGPDTLRVRQLWQATCQVTRRAYLLTCADAPPADSRVLALRNPGLEAAAPLVLLPFFQILSYQLTEDKHLWHKHPLCARLEAAVNGKSQNYVHKEVL